MFSNLGVPSGTLHQTVLPLRLQAFGRDITADHIAALVGKAERMGEKLVVRHLLQPLRTITESNVDVLVTEEAGPVHSWRLLAMVDANAVLDRLRSILRPGVVLRELLQEQHNVYTKVLVQLKLRPNLFQMSFTTETYGPSLFTSELTTLRQAPFFLQIKMKTFGIRQRSSRTSTRLVVRRQCNRRIRPGSELSHCRQVLDVTVALFGYSPLKLPVCASSLFSSSISKGQSNYSGRRRARSSISEALLLAANGERKRLVGGKTPTKGSAILAFASAVEADILDHQLDSSQLQPKDLEEELEMTKGCSFSDDGLCEHVTDMLQQPSCNEKVSKWLEESQHSTLFDKPYRYQTVSSDEESDVNSRETCLMPTQASEVCDYQDRNRLAYISPEINPTAQVPLKARSIRSFEGSLWQGY